MLRRCVRAPLLASRHSRAVLSLPHLSRPVAISCRSPVVSISTRTFSDAVTTESPAIEIDRSPILNQLSHEQRQTVLHGEGPLLVLAGPGTGKTHMIAARVTDLIVNRHIPSSEILVLTLSERAASTMQARVDVNVPFGHSDCHIRTFHAFAADLLQQFAVDVQLSPDFRTLSRGEESVFLLSHLPSLGLQRYQPKAGQPVALVRQLLDLFQRLSDACVTPQQYLRWAQQQSVLLNSDPIGSAVQNVQIPVVSESNDASVENDESSPSMSAPEIEMASHLELAQCYLTYSELKQRHNVMNFDDSLTEATRLLRERPDRCKTVPIQHIMIDEFQDVNPSLLHFIQALSQVHQHRNIVAVGDADQSIFAFRGSSPSLFDQFLSMFSGAKVASTSINYRSTPAILTAAHRLVQRNSRNPKQTSSASESAVTDSGSTTDTPAVQSHRFDSHVRELEFIAENIESERQRSQSNGKPLRYRDFAVLVRHNADSISVVSALTSLGLPAIAIGQTRLFDRPEIKLLLSFLNFLTAPADSQHLYYLLGSPLGFNLSPTQISALMTVSAQNQCNLFDALRVAINGADKEFGSVCSTIVKQLEATLQTIPTEATLSLLLSFLRASPLSQTDSVDTELQSKNIAMFLKTVEKVQKASVNPSLHFVLPSLNNLITFSQDTPAAIDDGEQAASNLLNETADSQSADAVLVLSIHRAKGLEFEHVYLYGATDSKLPGVNRRPELPVPEQLMLLPSANREQHVAEERRLVYVALTRARRRFTFTSSADYGGQAKRAMKESRFVRECFEDEAPPRKKRDKQPETENAAESPAPVQTEAPSDSTSAAPSTASVGEMPAKEATKRKRTTKPKADSEPKVELESVKSASESTVSPVSPFAEPSSESKSTPTPANSPVLNPTPAAPLISRFRPLTSSTSALLARGNVSRNSACEVITPDGAAIIQSLSRNVPVLNDEKSNTRSPVMDAAGLVSLSYSSVSEYMACPLRYFYNYVKHVPRPPSIHLVIGRAMHDAVEAYARAKIIHLSSQAPANDVQLQSSPPPNEAILHTAFAASFKPDGCNVPADEIKSIQVKCIDALTRFHQLESTSQMVPSLIEKKFVLKLGGRVRVSGVWDRVDIITPEGGQPVAVIKEYKKALNEFQIKTAKSSLQLHMYAWAFEAVFGFAPRQVLLQEIGSPQAAVFVPSPAVVDKVPELLLHYASRIQQGDYRPTPSARQCSFCPYANICKHKVQ